MKVHKQLSDAGLRVWLSGTSALDYYLRRVSPGITFLDVEGSLVDVARAFDQVRYPGLDGLDAHVVDSEAGDVYIRCVESRNAPSAQWLPPLSLRFDLERGTFEDPANIYRSIRKRTFNLQESDQQSLETILAAAILAGRYGFTLEHSQALRLPPEPRMVDKAEQRLLITLILTGKQPEAGLEILKSSGFIDQYWPLLGPMDDTDHSKEFHPEGNVWRHSLETFRYRKTNDLSVGLALLLHDCGKPYADAEGAHRFKNHADIGADYARRFLEDLGFSEALTDEVRWLIKYHMIPGAIERLPRFRTRDIMRSPRFPRLLELYRCDLSSTFRGPDGYYRACKVYRSFLKNEANPFRDEEGKKLLHRFVD